jgi:hypothetical protein
VGKTNQISSEFGFDVLKLWNFEWAILCCSHSTPTSFLLMIVKMKSVMRLLSCVCTFLCAADSWWLFCSCHKRWEAYYAYVEISSKYQNVMTIEKYFEIRIKLEMFPAEGYLLACPHLARWLLLLFIAFNISWLLHMWLFEFLFHLFHRMNIPVYLTIFLIMCFGC